MCYNKLGLAFQTPEAILQPKSFRSLGYMRAVNIYFISKLKYIIKF
jgi:hypothetical protein